MEQRKRFYVALAIYAVLGLLIWMTIDNIPIPSPREFPVAVHLTIRELALIVVGLLAVRTVLHWNAEKIRAERESKEVSS